MKGIASCGFQTCRFCSPPRFAFLHRRKATFFYTGYGASTLRSIFSFSFSSCKLPNQCRVRLTCGPNNCDEIGKLNRGNCSSVSGADACLHISEAASSSKEKAATMSKLHATALDSPLPHASDGVRREANIPRYASLDTGVHSLHFSSSPSRDRAVCSSPLRSRRYRTESDIRSVSSRGFSFRDDIGHAAAETYLITKLTFILLKFLGVGYRWLGKLCALALYALFLMPGFLQVSYSYFFDKRIHRSITYGPSPRNRLDFYLPEHMNSPKPVVAFVTGGAWIIGYKAWGSLLGLQLVEKDVIVACIDYRNFPQGTISDMVEDVKQGISFVCNNCASYGGDPNRVYLAGQSAGAHLAACALIDQAIDEIRAESRSKGEGTDMRQQHLTWKASQLKSYFAISGGYNLPVLVDHFNNRGLYRRLFLSIMEGEESLLRYSPEVRVQTLTGKARTLLPHVYLFHGTSDYSVPCDSSISFGKALASCGAQVTIRLFDGKTHTDLFLQDPMRGGTDALFEEILGVIHVGDKEAQLKHAITEKRRRLVPEVLLQLARSVSPF